MTKHRYMRNVSFSFLCSFHFLSLHIYLSICHHGWVNRNTWVHFYTLIYIHMHMCTHTVYIKSCHKMKYLINMMLTESSSLQHDGKMGVFIYWQQITLNNQYGYCLFQNGNCTRDSMLCRVVIWDRFNNPGVMKLQETIHRTRCTIQMWH